MIHWKLLVFRFSTQLSECWFKDTSIICCVEVNSWVIKITVENSKLPNTKLNSYKTQQIWTNYSTHQFGNGGEGGQALRGRSARCVMNLRRITSYALVSLSCRQPSTAALLSRGFCRNSRVQTAVDNSWVIKITVENSKLPICMGNYAIKPFSCSALSYRVNADTRRIPTTKKRVPYTHDLDKKNGGIRWQIAGILYMSVGR